MTVVATATRTPVDALNHVAAALPTVEAAQAPELAAAYETAIRTAGKAAAAAFRARVIDPDAIAAAAGWQPPQVDEIVPASPDQQAAERAAAARRVALEAFLVDLDLPAPLTQRLLDQLAARADRVLEGIREPVARTIARSYVNGLSVAQTADAILEAVDGVADWQAEMLARTDLVSLGNGGSILAARQLVHSDPEHRGLWKQWLHSHDELVRPTHVDAGGQTVPLDQPFIVGDAPLDYPGDPRGPDAEILNCRCSLIYVEQPPIAST